MLITAGRLFSGGLARPRVRQYPVPLARRPPDHLQLVGKSDSYFRLIFSFPSFSSVTVGGRDPTVGHPTESIWSGGQIRVSRRILGFSSFPLFLHFFSGWDPSARHLFGPLVLLHFLPPFGLPIGFPLTHSGYGLTSLTCIFAFPPLRRGAIA